MNASFHELMGLENNGIILFDGVCNLCNNSVDFVISRDPERYFRYASLQSESGAYYVHKFKIDTRKVDSVLLVKNDKIYQKSTAALRIARKLKSPVKLLYVFIVVPPFIRNIVYDFIARNRYRWFGKRETCRLPTNEERDMFLP